MRVAEGSRGRLKKDPDCILYSWAEEVPLQKLLVGSLAFSDALLDGASLAFKAKETAAQFIISVCDSFEISSLTLTNSPTVAWIPGEGIPHPKCQKDHSSAISA